MKKSITIQEAKKLIAAFEGGYIDDPENNDELQEAAKLTGQRIIVKKLHSVANPDAVIEIRSSTKRTKK